MIEYVDSARRPLPWVHSFASFSTATIGIVLIAAAIAFSWAGSTTTKAIGGVVLATGLLLCVLSRTKWLRLKLRVSAMFLSMGLILVMTDLCLRVTTSFPVNAASGTIPHPDLGYVLDPHMPDVDSRGFRNSTASNTADLVAIGDSHTQGFGVDSRDSWPQVLGRLLNRSVYNFGVGGYGPLQYEILIDEALKLHPNTIVIGLYTGNDFSDASQPVTRRETTVADSNPFRHMLKYETAIGSLCHHFASRTGLQDDARTAIKHTLNPTEISHRRLAYLNDAVDLSSTDIRRGFVNTLQILSDAHRKCAAQQCRLVVLVIPTREFVYGNVVDAATASDSYRTLLINEASLHQRIAEGLRQQNIPHTSALPCLHSAMEITNKVYADYDDGHPRESGYVAYAAALTKILTPAIAQR